MARAIGQWKYIVGSATIMPEKPIIEPIDRSNSPAIINRHAPTEMRPRYAATCDQFITPSRLNMPELPAAIPNTRNTITVPARAANSGRFSRCRNHDSWRTRSSAAAGAPPDVDVVAVFEGGCLRG